MTATTEIRSTTFTKPDDTQLVATRLIDAPRELVWAAHTQCEHVKQWLLGPEGWMMPVCEIDLRPGGKWRYVFEGPDAPGFQMGGTIREVQAPELLVQTEIMNEGPVETLDTMTLTEEGGRTFLTVAVDYPSKEVREEIIATGMMGGWAESYDRLEAYLKSIR